MQAKTPNLRLRRAGARTPPRLRAPRAATGPQAEAVARGRECIATARASAQAGRTEPALRLRRLARVTTRRLALAPPASGAACSNKAPGRAHGQGDARRSGVAECAGEMRAWRATGAACGPPQCSCDTFMVPAAARGAPDGSGPKRKRLQDEEAQHTQHNFDCRLWRGGGAGPYDTNSAAAAQVRSDACATVCRKRRAKAPGRQSGCKA